jgi:hypothetical protein
LTDPFSASQLCAPRLNIIGSKEVPSAVWIAAQVGYQMTLWAFALTHSWCPTAVATVQLVDCDFATALLRPLGEILQFRVDCVPAPGLAHQCGTAAIY